MKYALNGNKIIFLTLICCLIFLVSILFCLEIDSLERVILPFLISTIIATGIFFILNILNKDKFCSKIYIISVLLHFIFILSWQIFKYHILGYHLPTNNIFKPFTVDNDGVLYHYLGVYVAKNFTLSTLQEHLTGGLFPKIIGILYYYFGVNPFLPCLLNCLISGFTAIFIYLIGKNTLEDKQIAKIYSILSILTFSHIINTSVLMRDGYITIFMYTSIYASYLYYKFHKLLYLLLTIISIFALYLFRPYAAIIILLAIIAAFVFTNLNIKIKNNKIKTNKLSFSLILFSPLIITAFIFILIKFSALFKVLSVEDLINIREASYQYGAAEVAIDFGALYSKFFLLPFIVGYIYLFFAPFPWEWIYPRRMIYVPDMFLLYLFLPSFFKNIKKVLEEKKYLLVVSLFSLIFMFSIYCITLGNTGAIHRLRGPFIPIIYIIAISQPNNFIKKLTCKLKKRGFI